ncbi:GNAT family N-acetyltransferase [Paenibacillus sedimenti]|uniref:GNAT family N-acetyltransferase n=1 Tax=Paenibacillus sedimenti TaxID=2770274 RepID=A0A926QIX3_9BACL|nr:GNAT family N-acetyltransferase [Paenibacillus sedimenti]MBD0381116.1 GNAT family N-acetyltransferase [Paenibacillus sedimenti]
MIIRSAINDQDMRDAYKIEKTVYIPEAAATLEAFFMRKELFGTYFLLAEIEEQIVGVTNGVRLHNVHLADDSIKQVAEFASDGTYFCILTIAVHPDYQRQGIASKLLKHVIQQAKRDQLKGIVLMCEEHLIEFYVKHGFHYVSPSSSTHGGIQWHEMSLNLK